MILTTLPPLSITVKGYTSKGRIGQLVQFPNNLLGMFHFISFNQVHTIVAHIEDKEKCHSVIVVHSISSCYISAEAQCDYWSEAKEDC